MDAVFYMQGAMDEFSQKSKREIGEIVMEIAFLGQQGLQLVSIMHTGIRLLDANTDPGTGLDREYEMAIALRAKK
jgi:hypothetical protein